jgi:hypothetical protein
VVTRLLATMDKILLRRRLVQIQAILSIVAPNQPVPPRPLQTTMVFRNLLVHQLLNRLPLPRRRRDPRLSRRQHKLVRPGAHLPAQSTRPQAQALHPAPSIPPLAQALLPVPYQIQILQSIISRQMVSPHNLAPANPILAFQIGALLLVLRQLLQLVSLRELPRALTIRLTCPFRLLVRLSSVHLPTLHHPPVLGTLAALLPLLLVLLVLTLTPLLVLPIIIPVVLWVETVLLTCQVTRVRVIWMASLMAVRMPLRLDPV